MTTDADTPRTDDHQDLRLCVLLLALAVGLVIVALAVYLSYQHPMLAAAMNTGGTVAAVLVAGAGIVYKRG
ncbi:hypothetical protein [Streptomyces sp. NPDC029674]|uniref:hypothetical protein n=1 Tax=Streptomyces sp. NPDC029674 TaxID=3365297 RepID=UPI00384C2A45